MKLKFIPLDYQNFDFNSKNYILIYGRTIEGKKAVLVDCIQSYLWAILEPGLNDKQIENLKEKIRKNRAS